MLHLLEMLRTDDGLLVGAARSKRMALRCFVWAAFRNGHGRKGPRNTTVLPEGKAPQGRHIPAQGKLRLAQRSPGLVCAVPSGPRQGNDSRLNRS